MLLQSPAAPISSWVQRIRILCIATCLLAGISSLASAADSQVPHEVGGFSLGADISDYPEVVNSNYLKETVITDRYGFRKGVLSTGVCKYPGIILKMQLKYEDSSKKFFKELLERYKKKFGPPHEWKGDSFGILHIWKWYFVDNEGRKVSMLIQHNLRNTNESIGNLVKMTYPELLNEERDCFNQMCEEQKSKQDLEKLEATRQPDWEYMIPR